jgi:hypothetical protein
MTSIQNKKYTKRKLVNSVIRFYNEATTEELVNGKAWYNDAHNLAREYASKTGYNLMNVCGVISALSPQTSWELNKVYLVRFLRDGVNAKANTGLNKDKAKRCLEATNVEEIKAILNGDKTTSFFLNILFPDVDEVATIDRHAVAITIQRPDKVKALKPVQLTSNQYRLIEQVYVEASKKIGIKTLELQAITWVAYRRLRGLNEIRNTL